MSIYITNANDLKNPRRLGGFSLFISKVTSLILQVNCSVLHPNILTEVFILKYCYSVTNGHGKIVDLGRFVCVSNGNSTQLVYTGSREGEREALREREMELLYDESYTKLVIPLNKRIGLALRNELCVFDCKYLGYITCMNFT